MIQCLRFTQLLSILYLQSIQQQILNQLLNGKKLIKSKLFIKHKGKDYAKIPGYTTKYKQRSIKYTKTRFLTATSKMRVIMLNIIQSFVHHLRMRKNAIEI